MISNLDFICDQTLTQGWKQNKDNSVNEILENSPPMHHALGSHRGSSPPKHRIHREKRRHDVQETRFNTQGERTSLVKRVPERHVGCGHRGHQSRQEPKKRGSKNQTHKNRHTQRQPDCFHYVGRYCRVFSENME